MAARIIFAIFGTILVGSAVYASGSDDAKTQASASVGALAGIALMVAALAFSLGEIASALRLQPRPMPMPMPPPAPMPPTVAMSSPPPAYPGQGYPQQPGYPTQPQQYGNQNQ